MYKRILSLLLALVLVVGALPLTGSFAPVAAATDDGTSDGSTDNTAEYVSTTEGVGGKWIGKVGADGYYLPFFKLRDVYQPQVDAGALVVYKNRYATPATEEGKNPSQIGINTETASVSLSSLTANGIGITEGGTDKGYGLNDTVGLFMPSTTDASAIQNPEDGGATSYKSFVRAGGYSYTFDMPEGDQAYYVTLYAVRYNAHSRTTYSIYDTTQTTLLAQQTVTKAQMLAGTYVTFKVKGDFKLVMSHATEGTENSEYACLGGIFFDKVPTGAQLSGFTAQQAATGVSLSWTNSGTSSVTVERAVSGSDTWETLTTVEYSADANGSYSYTDTTAVGGNAYNYRVRTAGILPGETTDAVSVTVTNITAEYVGTTEGVGGKWIGKVGADGYFLPFYTIYENFNPLVTAENAEWTDASGRYKRTDDGSSGTRNTLNPDSVTGEWNSLYQWPEYVTGYSEVNTGDAYGLNASRQVYIPSTNFADAPQDPRDGATTSNRSFVRNGCLAYKFTLDDDAWHYVTVYAARYAYPSAADYIICDELDSAYPYTPKTVYAKASVTQDQLTNGVYITFKVKGSFVLYATKTSGDYAVINGIFFDAVPTGAQLSGLTAQQSGTDVSLTWTYTGTNLVEVQRKASGEETWTTLGTVAASANAYTDTTVQTGSTYDYRVCTVNAILSDTVETSATASVTVEEPTAELVGMVTGLGGDWIGKVGAEGYFLPFYTIYGAYGEIDSGRYDTKTTECTGWSLQEKSSIIKFPSWITATMSTDEINTHNGYVVDSTHFRETTDTRAPEDPREGATTRIKSYVKGGSYIGYDFKNSDDTTWRYVTVYATCYNHSDGAAETIRIQDYKGSNVIAEQAVTLDELRAGVYITFKVKGSFTLKAYGNYAFMTGIFFDEIPTWEVSGFTATLEEGSRTPTLTWMNHATATQVIIERKDTVTETWTRLAVTEAGATSYTDTTCEVNKTYIYRIAPTNSILCGSYSAEQSVTMPTYTETVVALDSEGYTVNVKSAVTVNGTLKTAADSALAEKTVTITLAGELVDKGFVQAVQGTATTAADGSFTKTLEDLPAGTYTLTVSFAVDDDAQLAQSSADAQITIEVPGWSGAPVLTTVSDGVAPGDYFSINGYGMSGDQVIAKIGAVGSAVADATALTIAQHDATDGYFVQALMPAGMAGTYQVWVSNDNGTTWSDPILLNAARPLFISEDTAWNGLTIDISGRNLLSTQFGATTPTAVRLVPVIGGDAIAQTVTECNPYRIAFTVTGATAGVAYHVEATNDGTNWARITSGQTLTIKAEGKDPLGLGVAWAGEFNWDDRFVVTDAAYGATNNDATDDTAAIQAAVNAAAAQENGGVVYLPAGKYYVSSIKVPAHVVILGESTEDTILYYIGINGVNMFDSDGSGETIGWHGFARFTIRLTDNSSQPRTYFNLGHEWTNQTIKNVSARTSGHIFLSEVDIDTDVFADGGSPRGNAIVPVIGEHFLMHDCHFVGYRACIASGQIGAYASIRDSYMEIVGDFPQCNANYTFIVNFDLYVHYETAEVSHGITVRGSAHIEDCYVFGTGGRADSGDGEALLAEATTYYDYGRVVSVDGTKIQLDGEKGTLSNFEWRYGKVAIMIIDGTGIGQYRIVDLEKSGFVWNSSNGSWTNTDTSELVVTEPWDVEPDATSMYSLELIMENVTFCENLIDDCSNAMMFYGNVVDGVIAGNDSIDSKGIWIYSSHVKGNGRVTTAYRISVRDNDIIGVSRTTDRGGIYVHTQRSGVGGEYVAVFVYGLDIKDNRIYGDPTRVPEGTTGGTPPYNGIVIAASNVSSDDNCKMALGQGDATNIIIQNNVLKNLRDGIYYTNCTYGTLLAGNYFEGVQDELIEIKTKGNDSAFLLLKNIGDATAAPACDDHDCNDWDTTVAPAVGTCVWCETSYTENVLAASIGAHAVTLGDSVDLDFFLDLSADVRADENAYVKVTLPDMNGTIIHVPVSGLTSKDVDGETLYLLPCSVSAKEMTGIVRLQVFSGDWNSSAIEFTVQDYAAKILADPTTYAKEQDVVKAMLNYGAAAQLHFGYNTGDLANSILAEEDRVYAELDTLDLTSWNALTIEDTAAVDFIGATLMLEGKTGLRLYFNIADPSAYTFTCGSTELTYVAKAGSGYTGYVEVEGIVAKDLGNTYTVTVKSSDEVVATVNHSPMKYGYNVKVGTYAETLDNLVAALYAYYTAADAYFSA